MCMAPLSALAVTYAPGTGNSVGADGTLNGLDGSTDSIVVKDGNGIVVQGGGINLGGKIYVGVDDLGAATNQLYVETGTDVPFNIVSGGNITATGVDIRAGRDLSIGGSAVIDVTLGEIINLGKLNVYNINSITTDDINNSGTASFTGNEMHSASITNHLGNMSFDFGSEFGFNDLVNYSAGTVTVDAGNIDGNSIQNNSGSMLIEAGGGIELSGNLENSGTLMEIDAGGITVVGTMKNDNNAGAMIIRAVGLEIQGGNGSNPSFVNAGNFTGVITNNSYFEYGVNLSRMNTTNTFSLDTGALNFGTEYGDLFSNKLNSLVLNVRNSGLDINTDLVNGVGNSSANFNLTAVAAKFNSIENIGDLLKIKSTGSAATDGITIVNNVTTNSGSNTVLESSKVLKIGGALVNNGTTTLNGESIDLYSVVNNLGTLKILAPTSSNGSVNIASNVTNNNGTLNIEGREIDIDGAMVNVNGVTNIRGSDASAGSVEIGSINVQGGTLNIDALIGSVAVDSGIDTSGGQLVFGSNTYDITAGNSINIDGDLYLTSQVNSNNNGDLYLTGSGARNVVLKSVGGNITIDGNVEATVNDAVRSALIDATIISVGGDVMTANRGRLIFGDTLATHLNVTGGLISNNGGLIDLDVADVEVGSLSGNGKFIVRSNTIEAINNGDDTIDITRGIWFDGSDPTTGMVVKDTNDLTLVASGTGADISVANGIAVGTGNKLTLTANDDINVYGIVTTDGTIDVNALGDVLFANGITNTGIMTIDGATVNLNDVTNSGSFALNSGDYATVGDITNSGTATFDANKLIAALIVNTAGVMDIDVDTTLTAQGINVSGGALNLSGMNAVTNTGNTIVTGDFVQGANTGNLNLITGLNDLTFAMKGMDVSGDFTADAGHVEYRADQNFKIDGDVVVNNPAVADFYTEHGSIAMGDITNNGSLSLYANSMDLGAIVNDNNGSIYLETTGGIIEVDGLSVNSGEVILTGNTGDLISSGVINLAGGIYHNSSLTRLGGDLVIDDENQTIFASSISAKLIDQAWNKLILNTDDLNITGNVSGTDLRIASRNSTDWLNVAVGGSVSGGVDFIGVEKMTIGENYLFDENSKLHAAIGSPGSKHYWASVSLNNDNTLGQITDDSGSLAEALITVNGKFITNIKQLGFEGVGALDDGQMGIMLNDIVDQGSAIWLLYADGGLEEAVDEFGNQTQKMRNLYVKFCNADGSLCYNYLDSLGGVTTDENGLPVYLSVRDHNSDGTKDSLYIVFDPRFGGPIEVFKIQPIVDATDDRTNGEYTSAGALDDMIAGRLHEKGFFNRNPIETIPIIFEGTNREEMARELYDRMEQYQIDRDGTGLARFSRLFQPREIEQIVGSVALNEHTNFRDFEDRMLDEFIWNRHRELKKAWVDVDFGMFTQNSKDGKHIDGDRFSVAAGVDWKQSETLLLGVTARVSYSSSNDFDDIDLGYMPNQSIRGRVDMDVANTNVGLGVYLMNILNEKLRFYGNGYLDLHWLDVSRDQTYVDHIDGTGTAFSFMTEWGLMHDWLNQYIVGNVYARAGYNFGFSVTEKVNGSEYMKLESDGYLVLTPGYSLIAQKRIYPSAWFQMRPYLSVGVEYDVLGNPDTAQYKFASANKFTDYDVEIDPLWANGGGGIEFLSATGLQIGLDYRYQYNSDIQMHKIKLSGSYRF